MADQRPPPERPCTGPGLLQPVPVKHTKTPTQGWAYRQAREKQARPTSGRGSSPERREVKQSTHSPAISPLPSVALRVWVCMPSRPRMGWAGPTDSAGQSQNQLAGCGQLDGDSLMELTGSRKPASPRLK